MTSRRESWPEQQAASALSHASSWAPLAGQLQSPLPVALCVPGFGLAGTEPPCSRARCPACSEQDAGRLGGGQREHSDCEARSGPQAALASWRAREGVRC